MDAKSHAILSRAPCHSLESTTPTSLAPGQTMSHDAIDSNESSVAVLDVKVREHAVRSRYQKVACTATEEDELVRQYLPLVKQVVGRLAMNLPSHVDKEDLYSTGLIGLLDAIRNYDPTCGASLETYARIRIRGAVFDGLRRMQWMPRSVHDKAGKIQDTIQKLEQAKGEPPTDVEVANTLKIPLAEYHQWLEECKPVTFIHLDAACNSEGEDGPSCAEQIPDESQESPDEIATRNDLIQLIARRLDQMPEMHRKVLALYYFEDLRLREIAAAFGLTESRICQIHSEAILSLRAFLAKNNPQIA
ncbi:MAG: FliA/WhiG family RNA polymerase sigma factor [Verrucomicrobiia bacterium]